MSRHGFQQSFLPPTQLIHGGSSREGRRKIARPIDPKRPMHVSLKATSACGHLSLLHTSNAKRVQGKVSALATRYRIRVYQYANSGNHLHVLISGKTRRSIQNFMKALASQIAQLVTGARKGKAFGKFWDSTFFSRVVSWGRDFTGVRFYVLKNELEAEGWTEHDRVRRTALTRGEKRARPEFPKAFASKL
jgi:REP element-mobilizing transposase RayT